VAPHATGIESLGTYVAAHRHELRRLEAHLADIRDGKRRGPHARYGWPTAEQTMLAHVDALRAWIAVVDPPDRWVEALVKEVDPAHWERRLNARRRDFVIRRRATAEWLAARPTRAKKRRKSAERRAVLAQHATAPIRRDEIYARDGGRCWICGGPVPQDDFHLDHVVPPPRGVHGPENVRVAHPVCNVRRGTKEL
jgi:5-methylcytosine-specific restriction endonuclease McrA